MMSLRRTAVETKIIKYFVMTFVLTKMYIFLFKYSTIIFAFLAFFVIDTYINLVTTFQIRKSENLTSTSYEFIIGKLGVFDFDTAHLS